MWGRTDRIGRVLLACDEGAGDGGLDGSVAAVAELARRLGAPVVRLAGAEEHDFVEGDVLVVAVTTSGSATGLPDPPDGAAIVAVPISVGSVVEG